MDESRALVIHGPYLGASGHDHHVREFVRHLSDQRIRIQLIDIPDWGRIRLPDRARDPWFDTLGAPIRNAERGSFDRALGYSISAPYRTVRRVARRSGSASSRRRSTRRVGDRG